MSNTASPRPPSASAVARNKRMSSMSPAPGNNGNGTSAVAMGSPSPALGGRAMGKTQGIQAGKIGRTSNGVVTPTRAATADTKSGRPSLSRPSSSTTAESEITTPSRAISPLQQSPSSDLEAPDTDLILLHSTSEPPSNPDSEPNAQAGEDGILGGLMERSEEELERAGVEELRVALRKEWAEKEEMTATLDTLQANSSASTASPAHSTRDLQLAQTRLTQSLEEQDRLQLEIQEKTRFCEEFEGMVKGLIGEREGWGGRIGELEKTLEESQAAALAREKELENQLEAQRRIARDAVAETDEDTVTVHASQNTSSTISTASFSTTTAADATLAEYQSLSKQFAQTQSDLDNIREAHEVLRTSLASAQFERDEFKILYERAHEENEGFEVMLRERTLQGRMNFGGIGGGVEDEGSISRIPSSGSAASVSSSVGGYGFGGARAEYGQVMGSVSRGMGKSLAEELGRSEQDEVSGELEEKIRLLELDNRDLQRANTGLKAYVDRTLDRIAKEGGLINVLNADYDSAQRPELGRSNSSSDELSTLSGPSVSRPSIVMPRVVSPSGTPSGVGASGLLGVPQSQVRARVVDPTTGLRPLSMVINQEAIQAQAAAAKENLPSAFAGQAEKRARRGLSMNLSSLFGTSSITPSTSGLAPKPPSPMRVSSFPEEDPMTATVPEPREESPRARKLECHPEDEEDRIERDRLAATMKLLGVSQDEPDNMATPTLPSSASPSLLQTPTFSSSNRASLSAGSPPLPGAPRRSNSALYRFSSMFSKAPSAIPPLSPEVEKLDPNAQITDEMAADMLKAYDKREKEMMAAKSYGGLTAPPEGGLRAMAERRRKSGSTSGSQSPPSSVLAEPDAEHPPQELDAEGINAAWTASSKKGKSSITTLFEVEDPHE